MKANLIMLYKEENVRMQRTSWATKRQSTKPFGGDED
jgi:hypothetical protein